MLVYGRRSSLRGAEFLAYYRNDPGSPFAIYYDDASRAFWVGSLTYSPPGRVRAFRFTPRHSSDACPRGPRVVRGCRSERRPRSGRAAGPLACARRTARATTGSRRRRRRGCPGGSERGWPFGGGGVCRRFPAERARRLRPTSRVYPGRPTPAGLDAAVYSVFDRFAVCFADLLSLNRGPQSGLWRHVRGSTARSPRARRSRGGAAASRSRRTSGNWELAGRLLTVLGRPVHVVMAPEADPAVGVLLDRGGHPGVRFVRVNYLARWSWSSW